VAARGTGPRVLVVTNMWPGDGSPYAGIFVRRQVEALRRVAPSWTFDTFVMAGRRGRSDYLLAVPRLRRALRAGYDLVHAHYGFTGATAAMAGSRPLVVTLHGGDVDIWWQRPITAWGVRRADRVIAVSERSRAVWGDASLPVLPCGVPTGLFGPRDRAEARRWLGIDMDAPTVLFPADPAVPVKDWPLFRTSIDRLTEPLRDQVVVRVLADVEPEEAPWHIAAADVVVVTSQRESGPLVVKESLAMGVPVVSVDVGDAGQVLAGVAGCAVVPHDPAAIAAAVERVLASRATPPDPERLRARVLELGLDDDAIARRLLTIYEETIAASLR